MTGPGTQQQQCQPVKKLYTRLKKLGGMSDIDKSAEGGRQNELGPLRSNKKENCKVADTVFFLNFFVSKFTKIQKCSRFLIENLKPFSDHFEEEINFCSS